MIALDVRLLREVLHVEPKLLLQVVDKAPDLGVLLLIEVHHPLSQRRQQVVDEVLATGEVGWVFRNVRRHRLMRVQRVQRRQVLLAQFGLSGGTVVDGVGAQGGGDHAYH